MSWLDTMVIAKISAPLVVVQCLAKVSMIDLLVRVKTFVSPSLSKAPEL
jgi:hypothetical protein